MEKLEWLTRKNEDGLSALHGIIVLGIIFLIAGIVGTIEYQAYLQEVAAWNTIRC